MNTVKIYGLTALPSDQGVRYVGVTKRAIKNRLYHHVYNSINRKYQTYKDRWIRKCVAKGLTIHIILLAEVPAAEWELWERHWIAKFDNLTNSTSGGQGSLNMAIEVREKIGAAHRNKIVSEISREKMRIAWIARREREKGKKHSEETKAKISASNKGKHTRLGYKHSQETIDKIRLAHRRPEMIEKHRLNSTGRKLNQESIIKIKLAVSKRIRNSRGLFIKETP